MTDEVKRYAEAILNASWGHPVVLGKADTLGGSDRSNVYRFHVTGGLPDSPPTVVAKQAACSDSETYDPTHAVGPAWRLFNEWAGLQFLSESTNDSCPTPGFYGGDRAAGVVVLEDLGAGVQLDHLLLGENAEAARRGLLGLMSALGTMHGLTIGRRNEFERLRTSLGLTEPLLDAATAVTRQKRKLEVFLASAGVEPDSDLPDDFDNLVHFMDPEGPFIAFSHHDPCPDNCLYVGEEMKLLDFEFGGFRNALLDGVYGRILFPSCWCVNALPEVLADEMEHEYWKALSVNCSAARDREAFSKAVVEACIWHLVSSIYPELLEKDAEWGISTTPQRLLARLDSVAEVTRSRGHMEGLGSTAEKLAKALRLSWPSGNQDMPLYPAFR